MLLEGQPQQYGAKQDSSYGKNNHGKVNATGCLPIFHTNPSAQDQEQKSREYDYPFKDDGENIAHVSVQFESHPTPYKNW